jgi:hypothetical protein
LGYSREIQKKGTVMKFGLLEILIIIAMSIQIVIWVDKRQHFDGWEDVQLQSQITSDNLDSLGIALLKSVMIIDSKEATLRHYVKKLTKMHHMQETRIRALEKRLELTGKKGVSAAPTR